jgi:uncharacterized protein (TIGR00269 family)
MKCEQCSTTAIISNPCLCAQHFDTFILQTTQDTIARFSLFDKDTTICVAVSGGKDSLALLDVLTRLGYITKGLFIDEGIAGYREYSREDLDAYSNANNISVTKVSFQDAYGFTLDAALQTNISHACTLCGTFRRQLLNKHSQSFAVIATGHNLDDEAQTVLINLARGNTDLFFRLGPKTKPSQQFTQRVKPFYFLTEKQILTYTTLRGIKTQFSECPYATTSYRAAVRDVLNKLEAKQPGTKKNIITTYLSFQEQKQSTPSSPASLSTCSRCGQPSQDAICKACIFQERIARAITQTSSLK